MSNETRTTWISRIWVHAIVFLFGSTIVHAVVMSIDWLTSSISGRVQQRHIYHGLLAPEMLPMMIAYGALSVGFFVVWKKMRLLEIEAREKDLLLTEHKSMIETAQKLTAIVIEKISGENAVIVDWVCQSKVKGKMVSPRLENATENIGKALQALSRVSFEAPYLKEHGRIIPEKIEQLFSEFMSDDSAPVNLDGGA